MAFNQTVQSGLDGIFLTANSYTGGFLDDLLLFAFFMIIMGASFFSQLRTTGESNLPGTFAVAGLMTVGLAFLFSLIDGLVSVFTLTVTISISAIGIIWVFFSSR